MSNSGVGAIENIRRIQACVDRLADALGRSVELDDPSFAVLSASAQSGRVDRFRIASIIDRSPPIEPVPWLLEHGIRTAAGPVRLPAHDEHGLLPRICCPVRGQADLLGYLWVIEEPAVDDAALAAISDAAAELASLLSDDLSDLRERTLAVEASGRAVLAGRRGALAQAAAAGLIAEDGPLGIHEVRLREGRTGDSEPAARRLLLELGRARAGRSALAVVGPGSLTVLHRARSDAERDALSEAVRRSAVIVGSEAEGLGSAEVREDDMEAAVRNARFAAQVSLLMQGEHVAWERAGAWRLLRGWDLAPRTVREISEDAHSLIEGGSEEQWRSVLAYLDHGRGVAATADTLFIHRATLHYRLERARERMADGALEDGWRASALHVALRLHAALVDRSRGS